MEDNVYIENIIEVRNNICPKNKRRSLFQDEIFTTDITQLTQVLVEARQAI